LEPDPVRSMRHAAELLTKVGERLAPALSVAIGSSR
jgi:hypothetical protein